MLWVLLQKTFFVVPTINTISVLKLVRLSNIKYHLPMMKYQKINQYEQLNFFRFLHDSLLNFSWYIYLIFSAFYKYIFFYRMQQQLTLTLSRPQKRNLNVVAHNDPYPRKLDTISLYSQSKRVGSRALTNLTTVTELTRWQ